MLVSKDEANLRQTLKEICVATGTACIDEEDFSLDLANFILTWLETWTFLYKENLTLMDVASDYSIAKKLVTCHLESFKYAKSGSYIYNVDLNQFIDIARILSQYS